MDLIYHKIIQPQEKKDSKPPCLILLHGRGADENDLIGLSDYLDKRFLILSLRAPFKWEFGIGYTWFDMQSDFSPEKNDLKHSLKLLNEFLSQVSKLYDVDSSRIFIFGFSMGAMIGNLFSTIYPEKVFANISHSGYLPAVSDFQYKKIPNKPVFVAHGIYDPIVPIALGRETEKVLKELEANVTYKEYPIEHHICEESIGDISKWITDLLDKQ
ncbi:MAG: carboxylesterase family protein [Ignavibacteriae bacterium]|nr:MAG: carboxylesterase family protein [Ignavibacteriota bacterium]